MGIAEVLSSREEALIIWMLIIFAWLIYRGDTRIQILRIFKIFLSKPIVVVTVLIAIYSLGLVFIISQLGFWQPFLIKDTVFWFIGTAMLLVINLNDFAKEPNRFKAVLIDNFKYAVVLQFIVNKYTFDLIVEILLSPVIFMLTFLMLFTQRAENTKPVATISKFILSGIGFSGFIYAIIHMISDNQFLSSQNLLTFLLPILLTTAYIPLLYFLALYSAYEEFFIYVDIWISKRNKILAYKLKRSTLIFCNINLAKLAKFTAKENRSKCHRLRNENEIDGLIQEFNSRNLNPLQGKEA